MVTWKEFVEGMEDMYGLSFSSPEEFSSTELTAYVDHYLEEKRRQKDDSGESVE